MSNTTDDITVRGREIVDYTYDIIIIGGGVAGVCAAISAARMGSNVALVQDRPVLGGNSSSEVRVWAIGAATQGYFRNARETGILEEVTIETAYRSEGLLPAYAEPWPMWDLVLKDWCEREPTLHLYLNTRAHEVTVSEKRIHSIVALQVSTEKAFRLHASLFIDSSGDGEIGSKAGAIWRLGQESRHEFGETIAPEEADRNVLPSSLLFSARDAGRPVTFHPFEWAYDFPTDADLPFRHPTYFKSGYWWIETGGTRDTINDNEEIRDELYRILFGVWDHIKNHGDHGAENLVLDWVGHVVGKRESRRFEGDYIMVQDDVLFGRNFPDDVAYGGWPIDLHPPRGFFDPGTPTVMTNPDKPFGIPYRSLYSRNIENLFLNGRLLSASHIAMGSIRVQKTLGVVGQAVGTAAHLCLQHGVTPRQLGDQFIQELQQELLKQDCYVPHIANCDPRDLARTATVTASSHLSCSMLEPTDEHGLYTGRAQMFTTSAQRIDSVGVWLISHRSEAVDVTAHLHAAHELWDFSKTELLSTAVATLQPGHDRWITFPFNCVIDPARPYWIELEACEDVLWRHSIDEPHGCLAAAWMESRIGRSRLNTPTRADQTRIRIGEAGEATGAHAIEELGGVWHHLRGTYLHWVEPEPRPYCPENVVSGVTRPERSANIWISDPEQPWPHWLELDFQRAVTFDTVQLTFDSNLDRALDEGAKALSGPVPELVKDYTLLVDLDGEWQTLLEERGNHQRWRRHRFAPTAARRLRIRFDASQAEGPTETGFDPLYAHVPGGGRFPERVKVVHSARLYEVRVYDERHR